MSAPRRKFLDDLSPEKRREFRAWVEEQRRQTDAILRFFAEERLGGAANAYLADLEQQFPCSPV